MIRQAIDANKKQRGRVQDGYKAGIYDAAEAAAELRELEREAKRLHKKLEQDAITRTSRTEAFAGLQEIGDYLGEYLAESDPKQTNRLLTAYIQEIRVGQEVEILLI